MKKWLFKKICQGSSCLHYLLQTLLSRSCVLGFFSSLRQAEGFFCFSSLLLKV